MAGLFLLLTFHLGDVPPHKLMKRTAAERDKTLLKLEIEEAAPIPNITPVVPAVPDLVPDPRKRR